MKPFRKKIFRLVAVAVSFCYLSCNREIPKIGVTTDLSTSATVQVFSATVKAARNYIYVDNVPVSGAALAFGSVFPGTAYGFMVTAGSHSITIKDTALATTQVPLTFTQTFDAGKNYSIFAYDTITSPKQITVANTITIPSDTSARLRFANFVYNTTALPGLDVYSFKKGGVGGTGASPLFTNVGTTQVTDFVAYPSLVTDTLYIYATGTTSPLILKGSLSSLTPTRSYTLLYGGSNKGTKTASVFQTY